MLSQGRSHRTSTDAEMVGWGAGFARVEGSPRSAGRRDARGGPGRARGDRRAARASGSRSTAFRAGPPHWRSALPSVLFAPEDMLLVVGSPGLRRALLDELIVAAERRRRPPASPPTHAPSRSATRCCAGSARSRLHADELPYWDGLIVREGGRIVSWRLETLAALAGPLAAAHREIADRGGPLALRYVTNAPAQDDETPTDALRRRLAETAEKELWNGATLVGPHRDDVTFELDGRDLSTFASRGQQRTAILALKLAQVDLVANAAERQPLLLLDDVFSELDPDRRSHLVRRISQLPQAFVTTTTPDDLDPALVAASTAWRVEPGRLARGTAAQRDQERRRPMKRLSDVLPSVASQFGLDEQLERGRAIASWERLVAELVPAASGASRLLRDPPAGAHRDAPTIRSWRRSCASAPTSCWRVRDRARGEFGCWSYGRSSAGSQTRPSSVDYGPHEFPPPAQARPGRRAGPAFDVRGQHARHRAIDRLEVAHQGQPLRPRQLGDRRAAGARRGGRGGPDRPARVLLRRIGGNPDPAREVLPQRQPQAARPRRVGHPAGLDRHRRRGRPRQRAVRGHRRLRSTAYLVRSARLLVPEHKAGPGVPADDVTVDVWRGELAIGDSVAPGGRNA